MYRRLLHFPVLKNNIFNTMPGINLVRTIKTDFRSKVGKWESGKVEKYSYR